MARLGEPSRQAQVAGAIAAALGVDADVAGRLADAAVVESLRAHETLALAPAIVVRGAVKLVSERDVVLDLARAPLVALAGPWRWIALRASVVAHLEPSDLDAQLRGLSAAQASLAASLAERIESRAALTVEARLELLLAGLAARYGTRVGGGTFVALPLRGRDAASLLGTTTETISRVLAAWKRSGRVRASRDGIWVRAREAQRRYAATR